jgi:archaemetzincin
MTPKVALVPMGEVPQMALRVIAGNIAGCLRLAVTILPGEIPPAAAFDSHRRQFNAAILIQALESMGRDRDEKMLGVLAADLFLPIFTHVYGDARIGGRAGVVSLFRLQGRNGLPHAYASDPVILERAAKVALHELGHLFHLVHCPEPECLMHFSGDLEDLDRSPLYFCSSCMHSFYSVLSAF